MKGIIKMSFAPYIPLLLDNKNKHIEHVPFNSVDETTSLIFWSISAVAIIICLTIQYFRR